MFHSLAQHDKVTERHRAAVNNLLLHTDGFQIITCKRGDVLGLHVASQIIPSGESPPLTMSPTGGC